MTKFTQFLSTTALMSVAASAASADVSAENVWDAFKSQIGLYGNVTATQNRSGDALTVQDLTISTEIDGVTSSTVLTGVISFRELGDGTVAIEMPDAMNAKTSTSTGTAQVPFSMDFGFTQSGMTIIASGTPDNINHDFTAPEMTYTLNGLQVDGDTPDIDMVITMSNTAGSYAATGSGDRNIKADYTMGNMAVNGKFADQRTNENATFNINMGELVVTSDSTLPANFDPNRPELLFSSGFQAAGGLEFGQTDYAVSVLAEGQTTNITGTMANGSLTGGLDTQGVRYATTANSVAMQGAITGLPFPPVDVNFDESRFDFLMPLGQSEVAQDFKLVSTLKNLTVSDFLWAMVDPAQQLPRSPATVILDLSGKANWLVDIMNPEVADNLGDEVPGKIESLSLNDLQVTIAGAELTGKGAFTFDNNDLQTFNGMPRPQGAIDLALSGGITLLDKLTAMQLVPQEQAMGIKMMSGLFAKPGNGPDTLTTKIEIDANGGISANGQQLQ